MTKRMLKNIDWVVTLSTLDGLAKFDVIIEAPSEYLLDHKIANLMAITTELRWVRSVKRET